MSERLPAHYGVDPVARHPGLRARLPRRARHRRAQRAAARGAQPGRAAGARRAAATRRQADALGAQPARPRADERHGPAAARARRGRRDADGRPPTAPCSRCPRRRRRGCGSPTPARCTAARGSSCRWPCSIAHPAAGAFFLRREMLYTAMTRATHGDGGGRHARGRRARRGDAGHLAALRPARRAARAGAGRATLSGRRPSRATRRGCGGRSAPVYWIESCPPAAAAFEGSGSRSAQRPRRIRAR